MSITATGGPIGFLYLAFLGVVLLKTRAQVRSAFSSIQVVKSPVRPFDRPGCPTIDCPAPLPEQPPRALRRFHPDKAG